MSLMLRKRKGRINNMQTTAYNSTLPAGNCLAGSLLSCLCAGQKSWSVDVSARILFLVVALNPTNFGCSSAKDSAIDTDASDLGQRATVDSEYAKLQGTWELVARIYQGGTKWTRGDRYEFDGTMFRVTRRPDGVGPWRSYSLNSVASPKQINGLVAGPTLRTQTSDHRAIYRFENGELQVCISTESGSSAPTTFVSSPSNAGCELLAFKRVQPLPRGARPPQKELSSEEKIQTSAFYRLQPFVLSKHPDGKRDIEFYQDWGRAIRSSYWQDLVDLREIRLLNLRNCSYVGDAEAQVIGYLDSLEELDMHATDITDAGVLSLSNLPNLRGLDLSMTLVSDAAVPALTKVPQLKTLNLTGTTVTSKGIDELRAKRPSLEIISSRSYTKAQTEAALALSRLDMEIDDVADRYLESAGTTCRVTIPSFVEVRTIPDKAGQLLPRAPSFLYSICLEATAIAKHLAQLPAPIVVIVKDQRMDDSIFAAVQEVRGLVRLSLEGTQITNSGLSDLKRHQDLKVLQLTSARQLTDEGIAALAALKNLEELWIEGIDLTPAGVEPLLLLDSLKRLTVNRQAVTYELSMKFARKGVKLQTR